eukprot:6178095-Pleurochrysis_carterae.AAC.1
MQLHAPPLLLAQRGPTQHVQRASLMRTTVFSALGRRHALGYCRSHWARSRRDLARHATAKGFARDTLTQRDECARLQSLPLVPAPHCIFLCFAPDLTVCSARRP